VIITCNKCKTKFKVLDRLIPPEGKKVKCSCCGKIWKQENKSETPSKLGLWIFWIITFLITFSILYIGLIIVFGNQIPITDNLSSYLNAIGIPVDGGSLFGRSFTR
tara:strand:- start:270 stop:587 length:318 start_codon:yes stop_codon:yes gene_type:complete